MTTAVVFILVYIAGLIAAVVRHPIYGLYTYLWAFYLAPATNWWGSVLPDIRYLYVAALVTCLSAFVHKTDTDDRGDRQVWYRTTPGMAVFCGVVWMFVQSVWAVDPAAHSGGLETFFKHGIIFALIYTVLVDVRSIANFSIAHVVGCLWLGYVALSESGRRVEDLGGALNNSNLLAAHVTTGVLFAALQIVCFTNWRRWLCLLSVPFILNVVVLTQSRGAFLALLAGGVAGYLLAPKSSRKTYLAAGTLGLVLFSMLASNSFLERMDSIKEAILGSEVATASEDGNVDRDKRLEIAKGGVKIALDHPLGAGYRGTGALSEKYMPPEVLGHTGVRGAHNTFVGVLAEFGFPGGLIFVIVVVYVVRTLGYLKKLDDKDLPVEYAVIRASVGASLVAMFVGGQFSNYYQAEIHFWLVALLATLHQAARRWEFARSGDEAAEDRQASVGSHAVGNTS
jgi:hypothetical protein